MSSSRAKGLIWDMTPPRQWEIECRYCEGTQCLHLQGSSVPDIMPPFFSDILSFEDKDMTFFRNVISQKNWIINHTAVRSTEREKNFSPPPHTHTHNGNRSTIPLSSSQWSSHYPSKYQATAAPQLLLCSKTIVCRWLRLLSRGSAAARLLGLRVWIPPKTWMSLSCDFCVLSGRCICFGLSTRLEES